MRASVRTGAGSLSTVAAFVIGVPLGFALLWALLEGPLWSEQTERYLHHPVEKVEVVIQNPRLGHFGGIVSAPAFHDVMSFSLQSLGIPPTGTRPPKARLTW